MQKKIRVGIIGEERIVKKKILVTFSDKILDVLLKYETIPVGILPTNIDVYKELSDLEKQDLYSMIDLCDGVILQGGCYIYDYQKEAVKYIKEKNIPVLGICLGMQIMALSSDGEVGKLKTKSHRKKKKYVHDVNILQSSKLYSIIKKQEISVNSRHFRHVVSAPEYVVAARSIKDDVIEAIELPNKLFHIGVQWHPEDLIDSDNNMKQVVDAFFDACEKYDK